MLQLELLQTGCGRPDRALRLGDLPVTDLGRAGELTLAGGTPTLEETQVVGSASYLGVNLVVPFTVPQPDTNYEVLLSPSVATDTYAVTAKSTTDFTLSSAGGSPATVGYIVMRQL